MNKKGLKIIHISSPGNRTAGRLVFSIHEELIKKGHDSFVVTKSEPDYDVNVYSYYSFILNFMTRIKGKLYRYIPQFFKRRKKVGRHYSFLDLKEKRCQLRYYSISNKFPYTPDVIIIYALQDFINAKTVKKIYDKTGAKIYWLLYDAAPVTGGCHYPWDCEGYKHNCGKCPQLMSENENDISRKNWVFKNKYLKNINLEILAGSEWTKIKSSQSSIFREKKTHTWLVPVTSDCPNSNCKDEIKKELGLSDNTLYLLFGATTAVNERKGMKYLFESLRILKENNYTEKRIEIIILGRDGSIDKSKIPYPCISPGFINDKETLFKYYASSHIVVVPSVEDAGPMMINESIKCGTPVVSFEMGVAHDLVINNLTGYRARLGDSADLAKGMANILNLSEREYRKVTENCIRFGDKKLDIGKQTDKLIEIFNNNC